MEISVTAYLHFGDKLRPRTFPGVPRVGELVEVCGMGKLTVARVEYDEAGDAHLYLESQSRPL